MTISVRLSDRENMLIKDFAKLYGTSVSDFIRRTIMDRIEDEIDLRAYEKAMAEYHADPVTYTHEEVLRMLEEDE